ncbi:aspartate aminotransferase family protein [Dongia sp.]|uniref:aspartate aminotransferase family protein n=1 Tax=Dongia sp. TaxID=1977262 RepID=UPI0035B01B10
MSTGPNLAKNAAAQQGADWQPGELPKVDYGEGCYVFDTKGRRYIDGSSGPAVYSLGHANTEVNEAIKRQLDRIAHGYRYTFTSDPLEELTAMVAASCGGGLANMTFVSSGSEAVESCLKIALQYQTSIGQKSRRLIISRERSWHGNTMGATSISGFYARREAFEGAMMPSNFLSPANVYRPPAGYLAQSGGKIDPVAVGAYCAQELENKILELGADKVAAFIFEPVVGAAGGCVPAPPGYARRVREICDKYGVLMIADEVMCGAGRTGTWRALEHDGVEPDIISVAKGLAAGYVPLGVAIYHSRLKAPMFEKYGGLLTGHTFTGHTLACAAGVAVQKIIQRDHLVAKVREDGLYLERQLRAALADHPHVGDIRGRGFFWAIEIVQDRTAKAAFDPKLAVYQRLRDTCFRNGLICYPVGGNVDGLAGDIAIISPPFIATRGEIDEIVDILKTSLNQVLKEIAP